MPNKSIINRPYARYLTQTLSLWLLPMEIKYHFYNQVKIWNILDGDVKYIYSDVSQNEISVFILDFYYKRMIVGDTSGETKVFNVLNGAFLKSLPKHQVQC